MKNQLKTRQICLIFISFAPMLKLVYLPSVLSSMVHQDLWLVSLLVCLADFLCVAFVLFFTSKKNLSFFDLLEKTFGKTVAKIVFVVYGVYFFIKIYIPVFEQKNFIEINFYEILPKLITFLPFFFVSVYTCTKGFRALGRVADVMFWFTIFGLALIFFLSFGEGDFETLLPVMVANKGKLISAGLSALTWFGDGVYMLFFMNYYKKEKNGNAKIMLSFLFSSLLIVMFMIAFFAIFSTISERKIFALAKLAKYNVALTSIGRFDLFAVILLVCSMVFALILPLVMSVGCFVQAFDIKTKIIPCIVINTTLLLMLIFLDKYIIKIITFSAEYMRWFYLLMGYIIPILTIFLKPKENNYGET